MNKILFTFILLLSCDILLSQEQEHPNYFPLAVGNRWEYIKVGNNRLVMTITKDSVMDNGKKYYIFEYNLPYTNFYYYKDIFPIDPIRIDENGDIYFYNDLTQNEYLYLKFSESYSPSGIQITTNVGESKTVEGWSVYLPNDTYREVPFVFRNNVGMISSYLIYLDRWCDVQRPCPPFFNQLNILVYAIIDGEKVYSIEDSWEYGEYMRTNDINSIPTHPQEIKLHQNYPNPFNPDTRIDFEIPKTEEVKLVIYNTLGKEVKTLLNDELQAGKYSTTWNGKDNMNNKVSSGIYFYQLTFGNNVQSITKKLILIK